MWVSPDVVINKLINIACQLMFLGGLCFIFHTVYLLWCTYILGKMSLPALTRVTFGNINGISNHSSFWWSKYGVYKLSSLDLREIVKEQDLF